MKEYINSLGAAVILSALIDLISPEGDFKKYCRMVCGFMVIAVMLSPVTHEFSLENTGGQAPDLDAAEAQARARVLTEHKRNLEAVLEERFPPAKAYVEVDSEGNVTSVTLDGAPDRDAALEFIEREFGVGEREIKINENIGNAEKG